MRTQGEAIVRDGNRVLFTEDGKTTMMLTVEGKRYDGTGSTSDTAHTSAIAHNAANALDAMGLDGDKAIELLPQYIEWMSDPEIGSFDRDGYILEFMEAIQREKAGE